MSSSAFQPLQYAAAPAAPLQAAVSVSAPFPSSPASPSNFCYPSAEVSATTGSPTGAGAGLQQQQQLPLVTDAGAVVVGGAAPTSAFVDFSPISEDGDPTGDSGFEDVDALLQGSDTATATTQEHDVQTTQEPTAAASTTFLVPEAPAGGDATTGVYGADGSTSNSTVVPGSGAPPPAVPGTAIQRAAQDLLLQQPQQHHPWAPAISSTTALTATAPPAAAAMASLAVPADSKAALYSVASPSAAAVMSSLAAGLQRPLRSSPSTLGSTAPTAEYWRQLLHQGQQPLQQQQPVEQQRQQQVRRAAVSWADETAAVSPSGAAAAASPALGETAEAVRRTAEVLSSAGVVSSARHSIQNPQLHSGQRLLSQVEDVVAAAVPPHYGEQQHYLGESAMFYEDGEDDDDVFPEKSVRQQLRRLENRQTAIEMLAAFLQPHLTRGVEKLLTLLLREFQRPQATAVGRLSIFYLFHHLLHAPAAAPTPPTACVTTHNPHHLPPFHSKTLGDAGFHHFLQPVAKMLNIFPPPLVEKVLRCFCVLVENGKYSFEAIRYLLSLSPPELRTTTPFPEIHRLLPALASGTLHSPTNAFAVPKRGDGTSGTAALGQISKLQQPHTSAYFRDSSAVSPSCAPLLVLPGLHLFLKAPNSSKSLAYARSKLGDLPLPAALLGQVLDFLSIPAEPQQDQQDQKIEQGVQQRAAEGFSVVESSASAGAAKGSFLIPPPAALTVQIFADHVPSLTLSECSAALDRATRVIGQEFILLQSSLLDAAGALQLLHEDFEVLASAWGPLLSGAPSAFSDSGRTSASPAAAAQANVTHRSNHSNSAAPSAAALQKKRKKPHATVAASANSASRSISPSSTALTASSLSCVTDSASTSLATTATDAGILKTHAAKSMEALTEQQQQQELQQQQQSSVFSSGGELLQRQLPSFSYKKAVGTKPSVSEQQLSISGDPVVLHAGLLEQQRQISSSQGTNNVSSNGCEDTLLQ